MATTWDTLRRKAARQYGLDPSAEDGVLSDGLLLDRVNDLLREMADVGGGHREAFTADLVPGGPSPLSGRVIKIVDGTVRLDYAGDGGFRTIPELVDESMLRDGAGPLEQYPSGCPLYYYTQRGNAADAMLNLCFYPSSDTARTGGIRFSALAYPPLLTDAASTIPLQQGEERFLIPGICLALAETERTRGRADMALVQMWRGNWQTALTQYGAAVEESLRGSRRRVYYLADYDFD